MPWYALRRPDGSVLRQGPGKAHTSEREPGVRELRVDRKGDLTRERLDGRGRWYLVPELEERAIDQGHAADHGNFALAVAHAVKLIEARRLLGLPNLVEVEAAETGQDAVALAQRIVDNAAAGGVVKAEIDRRRAKATVRRKANG